MVFELQLVHNGPVVVLNVYRLKMGLSRFFVAKGDFAHHSRKRINAYNLWIMVFVSFGSLCYGYTANVISATLGELLTILLHIV